MNGWIVVHGSRGPGRVYIAFVSMMVVVGGGNHYRSHCEETAARLGGPADGRETGEVDPRRREELERAPLLRAAHSSALAAGEIGFPFAFASVLLEIGFLPASCIHYSREANSI